MSTMICHEIIYDINFRLTGQLKEIDQAECQLVFAIKEMVYILFWELIHLASPPCFPRSSMSTLISFFIAVRRIEKKERNVAHIVSGLYSV